MNLPAKLKKKDTVVTFRLTHKQKKALEIEAKKFKSTVSDLLRAIFKDYL